jgi:hypothetical protein
MFQVSIHNLKFSTALLSDKKIFVAISVVRPLISPKGFGSIENGS